MGLYDTFIQTCAVTFTLILASLLSRIIYMQKFHPLSAFPGPWSTTSFSISGALISLSQKEPEYLMSLVEKYGSKDEQSAQLPIRAYPDLLFFPSPSALKEIYWAADLNQKSEWYDTPALGPVHLFTTVDGTEHRVLRKALSNAPWTIGALKNTWEKRFDEQITLFMEKMTQHAIAKRTICLSDKVAEFAADIMSMLAFGRAFGCVELQRDERDILRNWRMGLPFFGIVWRWRFFRKYLLPLSLVARWCLPEFNAESGMGWLVREADRQVSVRERENAQGRKDGLDFMQHCLDARFPDGSSLSPTQKRAHVTLLIQAGADTTATAMGSILRFLAMHPAAFSRARAEIAHAENANLLSTPIQYEETRRHLPFFVAAIKEGLRLNPPATNLFARLVPKGGKVIDGHYIPSGANVMSHAYVVQRNTALYGSDAEEFKPERWLVDEKRVFELDAAQFTFGAGPRVCLGRDIAMMEMYKLLPEIVRRFDVEVEAPGQFVVEGGVAYNKGFLGRFVMRD